MKVVRHQSYGNYTPPRGESRTDSYRYGLEARGTVMIDGIPELQDMQNVASNYVCGILDARLQFTVGVARLHWKDDFVRKVGVKVAEENRKILEFKVCSVQADDSEMRIGFQSVNDEEVLFFLTYKYGGGRVQLTGDTLLDKELK